MFASITVPSLPFTEVDLSLVIQSASSLAPYGQLMDKSLPSTPGLSRPHSLVEDTSVDVVISAIVPVIVPLESPSRASAIASSHNSLESNFDHSRLVLHADAWPRTPTSIPTRPPRRSFRAGCDPKQPEEIWFGADVPFPRSAHVRSCTSDFFGQLGVCESKKRQAIYVTVARETR